MNNSSRSPSHNAYWSQNTDALLTTLDSTPAGLSADSAAQNLVRFGPNVLQTQSKDTALGLFLNQFKSPIVLILLVATLVSVVVRDWIDAVIILLIVLGSALLSFWQEYSASDAAEKLRSQVALKATVLRNGQPLAIPAEQVVPGDIVLLSAGSLIPADGVVLEARDLFVNQAVLTGETFPVEKMPGSRDRRRPAWPSAPTASSWAPASAAATATSWSLRRAAPPPLARSATAWRCARLKQSSSAASAVWAICSAR